MRLKSRFRSVVLVAAIGLFALSFAWLRSERSALFEAKQEQAKTLVAVANSVLEKHHAREISGEASREDAQRAAIETIRHLRHGDNYFWINDMHPRMVMHPHAPELDGKDLTDYRDHAGNALFLAMKATVNRSGRGFVAYKWRKPGQQEAVSKLSYVQGFAPWGWIIGTGIYTDDVEAAWRANAATSAGLGLSFIIALLIISTGISHSIFRRLDYLVKRMNKVAVGGAGVASEAEPLDGASLAKNDEIGILLAGFNEMLSGIRARDRQLLRHQEQLEDEVRERTKDLAETNDVLRREVAERKRAEKEAAAANRAKSEFLANMSHEIRTPLNGIIGVTSLVMETELSREQQEYLGMVKSSGESLMQVLNDILDFSKIEAGKLDVEAIPHNLRRSLDGTIRLLASRAQEKDLELIWHVTPDVPDAVIGDPGRVRQVLANLIGNAIKFTAKGEIVVRIENEKQSEDEVLLHVSVADTGIGIPADKHAAIFNAFTQADGTTTRRYGGTGLGLTICTRLVELMGGKIWLESAPGQGSTFHFTVRLGIQATAAGAIQPAPVTSIRGLPVLVVDDNRTNRRVLSELLTAWHMKPTCTDGAQQALAALEEAAQRATPFALVLLDAQMPEVDGFTLASLIRHNPAFGSTPMIMLTSAGIRGDGARCRQVGIGAYLTKPINQTDLLDCMLMILGTPSSADGQTPPLLTRHSIREQVRPLRILLAEDNLVNQRLGERLLQKDGHSVVLAGTGKAALEAWERGAFDLVLMDVQMPEMDGYEATVLIRQKEKKTGGHIPIIAVTAHAMKGDQERCLAAGMDGYVSKPIQPEVLYKTIEAMAPL